MKQTFKSKRLEAKSQLLAYARKNNIPLETMVNMIKEEMKWEK